METKKEGLINFVDNIKPTMENIRDGKRLKDFELRMILQFYLEVVEYLRDR